MSGAKSCSATMSAARMSVAMARAALRELFFSCITSTLGRRAARIRLKTCECYVGRTIGCWPSRTSVRRRCSEPLKDARSVIQPSGAGSGSAFGFEVAFTFTFEFEVAFGFGSSSGSSSKWPSGSRLRRASPPATSRLNVHPLRVRAAADEAWFRPQLSLGPTWTTADVDDCRLPTARLPIADCRLPAWRYSGNSTRLPVSIRSESTVQQWL